MSLNLSNLCEIRVPTFRRPKLLRRALLSILEQSYGHWRCLVLDDCPDGSARLIVEQLQDSRIGYLQNHKRLGALGNIDQSFVCRPMLRGRYAFVLEDDNYLLPKHVENSIRILTTTNAKVAFCNQYCEVSCVDEEPGQIAKDTILDWMYPPGIHSPDELLPALLFSHGFSNGSAFWRTDCLSDFQIGAFTERPEIQESLRLLRLRDFVYVSLEPTSVWRSREPLKQPTECNLSIARIRLFASNKIGFLKVEKERIDYQCLALCRLGVDRVLSSVASDVSAFKQGRVWNIERSVLLCGFSVKLAGRGHGSRLIWLLVGAIARYLIPSKLDSFGMETRGRDESERTNDLKLTD
jgi:glycosyltransferase involved in cell wall biosynthesis